MEKPKVHIVLFTENDYFYSSLFYLSESKESLDIIRKDLNTEGDVWNKDDYPLSCKKQIDELKPNIFDNYFFFRCMHDNEKDIPVSLEECEELLASYSSGNVDAKFSNHQCQYVFLVAGNIRKHRSLFDITVEEIVNTVELRRNNV